MLSKRARNSMSIRSCCFCNSTGTKVAFNTHNRATIIFCQKCNESGKTKGSKFSPPKLFTVKNDVIKCLSDPQFFIPNIDKDFLPRFAKFLTGFEQYSFAFLSKETSNLLEPENLVVARDMILDENKKFIPTFGDSNVLVTQNFQINNISLRSATTNHLYRDIFTSISSNELFIRAKCIELCEIQITARNFYLLLSPQLIELQCFKMKFSTLLNTVDFVERLHNIEKILFSEHGNDFTYCLELIGELKDPCINCEALKKFCHPFSHQELTFEIFTDTIQGWSMNQIKIFLFLNGIDDDEMLLDFSLTENLKNLYLLLLESK